MKIYRKVFEQKITLVIKFNHTLNIMINAAVGSIDGNCLFSITTN